MAVCNIFKSLKLNEGTFWMFSQYMEDVTNGISDGRNHRVLPSKFIALNGCYKGYKDGESFAEYITKAFENGCALCRNKEPEISNASTKNDNKKIQNISKSIFWQAMYNSGIIYNPGNGASTEHTIKYVGDINIHSYNKYDGMGYYELYLHLSNQVKPINNVLKYNEVLSISSNNYLEGYPNEKISKTNYCWVGEHTFEPIENYEYDKYDVNTIIVLYDVYEGDSKVYEDIPMGMYFTGPIKEGVMDNAVTMYISHDSIYNGSTSYALKICSKLVVNQEGLNVGEVTIDGGYNSDMIKLLEQMTITHNKMDELLNKTYTCHQNYKDLYAIFKNSQTNVPYIKNINGVDYWYVNGKRLSPATVYVTPTPAANRLSIICDWVDGEVVSYENIPSFKELSWQVLNNNAVIAPNKFMINGVEIYDPKSPYLYSLSNVSPQTQSQNILVEVEVEYEGNNIYKNNYIKFTWPSYCFVGDTYVLNNIPGKVVVGDKSYKFNYSNQNENHVIYMYPKEYGLLEHIVGSNGHDYINDFDVVEQSVEFGEIVVPYYVYVDKNYANVSNYTLEFK